MKKLLYSVRDDLSFEFGDILQFSSELTALRAVSQQVSSDITLFESGEIKFDPDVQHKTRSLFYLGAFEDGLFIPSDKPVFICTLSDSVNYYNKLLSEFNGNN